MTLYDFHEWLVKRVLLIEQTATNSWRRIRLRHSVKQLLDKPYKLSRKQKAEAKKYWKNYSRHFVTYWHELYFQKTGIFDVRFIPDDLMYTEIEPYFNDYNSKAIDNKCNYDIYFPDVLQPKTVFRRMNGVFHDDSYSIISKSDVIKKCFEKKKVVLKIALDVGYGGGNSMEF